MIEIPKIDTRQQTRERIKTKVKGYSGGANVSTFAAELESRISLEFHGTIEDLMSDLKEQEKRFLDAQSKYEFEVYRGLVKKILKMILEKGFKTRQLKLTHRAANSRGGAAAEVLDKIDENLIKLSQMITKSNDAFNLMKTFEEIRGLLLDLIR